MANKHLLSTVAIVGALAIPGVAAAQTAWVTSDLNMRAGPGTRFPVVVTIPANQSVTVHGCIEGLDWCDVSFGADRGWAFGDYIAYEVAGSRMPIPQVTAQVQVPIVTYETGPYWETHYRDRPFYEQRAEFVGGAGMAGGAIAGAIVGGPIGALIGGVAGATLGAAISPPQEVRTYVRAQTIEPVALQGELVVGAGVPEVVSLHPVPNYEYHFAIVNERHVLVDPTSRRIVYVFD